ncbi:MAG: hypothetical protein QXN01_04285 [Candidatus Anstonellales archaeon]
MNAFAFLLKDKQFFCYSQPRLVGNPLAIAKKMKESGVRLLHIKDLDIKTMKNFDIYDKLTYIINIQVEAPCEERIIKKLLGVKARVVVDLPCRILQNFKDGKKLLVGKIKNWEDVEGIDFVNDVVVSSEEDIEKAKGLGKRVLFWGETKKKVFAEIKEYV